MCLLFTSRRVFYFLLLSVICILQFPALTLQGETVLVAPVSKDKSTSLFTLSVFLKTPLRLTKLYLDLGFLFPWTLCDANYNSSSFRRIPCDATFCAEVGFGGLSCDNCTLDNPPDPKCIPTNIICGSFPENPVTGASISDAAIIDTLALPSAQGSLVLLANYTFSCSDSTAPGIAFFGSTGPYNISSKIDLSQSLVFTPLIVNPVSVGDTVIGYGRNPPSNQYFIGLTSILVNRKRVPVNATLLSINKDDGFGGTKISTATPYTLLESSIQKAFTELFVKEAASSAFNLTVTTPAKPFNVCYPVGDLMVNSAGPAVPTIDLVLHAPNVVWRTVGSNSMVRVTNKKKGVDLWCLGFVDGGVDKKTPIVIGGKQLEDNLLQFDLGSNTLGFTSSLLSRSLSCADFNVPGFGL
ncbi:basic 7S globulin-like [Abrus precatorius]|uniref:Basic 7S globulin-like n=1 Tax=Abrus precatorius TaxID=3816 RepID=A0A8B8MHG0_ABRPR|nr:basic 7S globulin-like [Abrus precatorius]